MVLLNLQIEIDITDGERYKAIQEAMKTIESNANSVKDLIEIDGLPNVYKLKETDD